MTTRLDGLATTFLPFNQGDHGAAGNPVNPQGGHRTAYFVGTSLGTRELAGDLRSLPRCPARQKEATRWDGLSPLPPARRDPQTPGCRHEAGRRGQVPGAALGGFGQNQLYRVDGALPGRPLHDAADKKVFDSVLVLSDRNVIDSQLQDAIFGFERMTEVVATIKGEGGSKSAQLASALSGTKKIVVCTIQTFPFALEEVRRLAATQGKRFAVIADEAHSSHPAEPSAVVRGVACQRLRRIIFVCTLITERSDPFRQQRILFCPLNLGRHQRRLVISFMCLAGGRFTATRP